MPLEEKSQAAQPPVSEHDKKKQTFIVRTIWTLVMIFGMFGIIGAGHIWTVALVVALQIIVFKECISITASRAKLENLPLTKTLHWYFLASSIFYLDGERLGFYASQVLLNREGNLVKFQSLEPLLRWFIAHHKFVSYCLYVGGFVLFVASLKKGHLKLQFAQLCITHMTLLLVVLQAHCIISNIFTGMIWFLLPVGLVITNDIFAYICGIAFGKTQLIEISPKKTVEGFVGAWCCTGVMSILLSYILSKYNYLICPVLDDPSVSVFSGLMCEPNPVFISQFYRLPKDLVEFTGIELIKFKPIYFHSMVLATFASLIAPFGGFFCSGLKRAFQVKDFGDMIPGHGGITDRMDCQFLMGSFSYFYYETFISTHRLDLGTILQMIIINLDGKQILTLVKSLHTYLYKSGIISEDVFAKLNEVL